MDLFENIDKYKGQQKKGYDYIYDTKNSISKA